MVKTRMSVKRRPSRRPRRVGRYVRRFPRKIPRSVKTYNTNVGLPLSKRVTMTYFEAVGLTSTSGIPGTHSFNLASIFDPDFTGVGHQPYGHDQWAAFYQKYYVSSATISVKWSNIATNNIPHKVFVLLDKDNTTDTNLDTRMEQTRGRGAKTLLANSNNVQTTYAKYSAKPFFGIKNIKDDHQLKAAFSASPTLPAYAKIGIQPIDSVSTSAAIIYGEVTIRFSVVMFDPIPFTGS